MFIDLGAAGCEYYGHRVNSSQQGAITASLTGELALVQGPPGTGKTYTAALIVRGWMEQPSEPGEDKVGRVGAWEA